MLSRSLCMQVRSPVNIPTTDWRMIVPQWWLGAWIIDLQFLQQSSFCATYGPILNLPLEFSSLSVMSRIMLVNLNWTLVSSLLMNKCWWILSSRMPCVGLLMIWEERDCVEISQVVLHFENDLAGQICTLSDRWYIITTATGVLAESGSLTSVLEHFLTPHLLNCMLCSALITNYLFARNPGH